MTPLDEAEVIRLLASSEGRQKVFPMIVDQYSQSLYWKIRSIVLTHEDADDAVGELSAQLGVDEACGGHDEQDPGQEHGERAAQEAEASKVDGRVLDRSQIHVTHHP